MGSVITWSRCGDSCVRPDYLEIGDNGIKNIDLILDPDNWNPPNQNVLAKVTYSTTNEITTDTDIDLTATCPINSIVTINNVRYTVVNVIYGDFGNVFYQTWFQLSGDPVGASATDISNDATAAITKINPALNELALRVKTIEDNAQLPYLTSGELTFGSFAQLGGVLWTVIKPKDGNTGIQLLPVEAFDSQVFSGLNSNVWATSDLRAYLNGDFFADTFSAMERTFAQNITHTVLDASDNVKPLGNSSSDYVRLLSEQDLVDIFPNSADRIREFEALAVKYWLETPIYSATPADDTNLRCIGSTGDVDGDPDLNPSSGELYVVPTLNIKNNLQVTGTGTEIDPFIFSWST
jgi:hypothetical protein